MDLVLASASPRRADLLRVAGYRIEIVAAAVDERLHPGEAAEAYVRRLASAKSGAGQQSVTAAIPVLGADTVVVVDDAILGKPTDAQDAERMLRRLSGRVHRVVTGVSLRQGGAEAGGIDATAVTMRGLTDADIAWYLATHEWHDKAGGYAIQGYASRFITRIDGAYATVVGLPVERLDGWLGELRAQRACLASPE